MRKTCLAAVTLISLLLFSSSVQAQLRVDLDSVTSAVRTVVQSLRESASHHDWEAMAPRFPDGLASVVEPLVLGPVAQGTVSFWLPQTEVSLDSLAIQLVARDIAAVRVNFRVRGAQGTWGAVLVMRSGIWMIHCLSESYAASIEQLETPLPGCVVRWPPDLASGAL